MRRRTFSSWLLAVLVSGVALFGIAPRGVWAQTATVGANWAQRYPATSPTVAGPGYSVMAYYPPTQQVVLFPNSLGGTDAAQYGVTWTFNGSTWTQQGSDNQVPYARSAGSIAYVGANKTLVMFGGNNYNTSQQSSYLGDTWSYHGTGWTSQSTTTAPSARGYAAMAQVADGTAVLFGGSDKTRYYGDTWTWNGSTWVDRTGSVNAVTPRNLAAMAYFPPTGKTVMFGGGSSSGLLNDTVLWDGSNWTTQSTANAPSARYGAVMAYDEATGTLILFGGSGSAYGSQLNDTWSYDGTNWTQLSPGTSPRARYSAGMAYQPAITSLVLYGGSPSNMTDTEAYTASAFVAPTTPVGTASGGDPGDIYHRHRWHIARALDQ